MKTFKESKIGEEVSNGTSTSQVYALEVRLRYVDNPPIEVAGMIVDGVWRNISTYKSLVGVPNNLYDEQAKHHGYLEHDAAMALAYWFLALAKRTSLEVRLVQYEFVSTHSITKKAELTPIKTYSFLEDKNS